MTNIQLLLEDYTALLRVGVMPTERLVAQRVRMNVTVTLRRPPKVDVFALAQTYDYANLIKEIEAMAGKHVDLLETFAAQLAKKLLSDKKLKAVEIQMLKLDIVPNGRVGIRYRFRK